MTDSERKIAGRQRAVRVLDELAAAGLIRYTLSSRDLSGPEPHLDITAQAAKLNEPLPAGLSAEAVAMWVMLTLGRLH